MCGFIQSQSCLPFQPLHSLPEGETFLQYIGKDADYENDKIIQTDLFLGRCKILRCFHFSSTSPETVRFPGKNNADDPKNGRTVPILKKICI